MKTKLKMKLAVFALLLVVLPFRASSYVCDTLIVEVRKARSLWGDSRTNFPDGYVKAVVDGRIKQTHVVDGKINPVWNKDLTFTNVKSNTIKVEVWDYDDFFSGADDHLKSCVVKLKPGSHLMTCGKFSGGVLLWYGMHCLKGNMKRKRLYIDGDFPWVH